MSDHRQQVGQTTGRANLKYVWQRFIRSSREWNSPLTDSQTGRRAS
jgi:hypothetical protein